MASVAREGDLLRYAFRHSLALACLVGVVVLAQACWLRFMVP